ncbi:hypothetical protein BH10ACI3_BH10ACI3_11690 [soil metagenome]
MVEVEGKNKNAKGKSSIAEPKALQRQFTLIRLLLFTFVLFTFAFTASAQDDPPETAPPPLKVMTKDERGRLDAAPDMKARVKLSLAMMDARIIAADKYRTGDDFEGVYRELGGFHALMDDSLDYLHRLDTGSGKVLDNFKRLEIGFRGFAPRLETIWSEMPLKYEDYVRKLLRYLRDARTKALEPQFGDSVLPGKNP